VEPKRYDDESKSREDDALSRGGRLSVRVRRAVVS